MANQSAGILLYRRKGSEVEFFLVHPGGPFWQKKDLGSWTIPKGEFTSDEDPLTAAKREFEEETGISISGNFIKLSPVKQRAGKLIHAWAVEGDIDATTISSNSFRLEWPPRSGEWKEFPEVDRADWFRFDEATEKINAAQASLLHELIQRL